jgi:predicted metal-dependent hydrolase
MAHRSRPPLTFIGERKTSLDGQAISYTLKRSARARCARLEIRQATGLTIVIPKYYDTNDISDLMQKKKRWILNNLTRYCQKRPPVIGKELKSGDSIPYLGQELKLVLRQNQESADSAVLEGNNLIIRLGNNTNGLDLVLEHWYRLQAAQLIKEKADELSARFGLAYNKLTIRGQRSRWGSCSHKSNLSFNWKLMMTPEPVIDYVVTHELLHIKEMNHTRRFWQLVSEHCPQWRERRKWLKEHEAELTTRLST